MNGKWLAVVTFSMVLALFAMAGVGASADDTIACPICDFDMSTYDGPLSETEVQGLLLALNDEYHAWAVYDQVLADHGAVRPFTNIKQSEATHIDAVVRLFAAYGVAVPENPWPGSVPSFNAVTDACVVGVEAEMANRGLYAGLFESTDRADIEDVYVSLQRASDENHLPAFERCADGIVGDGNGTRRQRGGQGEPGRGNGLIQPGNGQCEPGTGPGQGQPGNGQCEPGTGTGPGQGQPGNGQCEPGTGPGQGQPGNGQCEPGTGPGQGQPGQGRGGRGGGLGQQLP